MNIDECKDPSQVDWSTVKGLTQFEPMVRFCRSAGTAVSCSAAETAPAPTKRTLSRYESDPVYEDERPAQMRFSESGRKLGGTRW